MKFFIVFAALISVACAGWLGTRPAETNIGGAQNEQVLGVAIPRWFGHKKHEEASLFGPPQTSTNIVGYTSSSSPLNLS